MVRVDDMRPLSHFFHLKIFQFFHNNMCEDHHGIIMLSVIVDFTELTLSRMQHLGKYLNKGFRKVQAKMSSRLEMDICHSRAVQAHLLLPNHIYLKLPRLNKRLPEDLQ